jgi:pimeloyl-ACP methyl ester carboxylesterase
VGCAAHDFTHEQVCTDLSHMLQALSLSAAVFVGHDWGGAIVWGMARRFPTQVLAVGSVCTPFRPRSSTYQSVEAIAKRYPAMFYQVYFTQNGGAEAARELESDVAHTVRCFFRTSKLEDKLPQKWMTPYVGSLCVCVFNLFNSFLYLFIQSHSSILFVDYSSLILM